MTPEPSTEEKLLSTARQVAPQVGLTVDEVVEICHRVAAGVALEHAFSHVSPGVRALFSEAIREWVARPLDRAGEAPSSISIHDDR